MGDEDREHARPGDSLAFLARGGDMGALMRAHDWAATPLGPVASWPQSLRTTTSILLNSRYPMFLGWGAELCMLYNDAYRPVLGATKHPGAIGRPAHEVWAEIWDTLGPLADRAVRDGEPTWSDDLVLMMSRYGYLEETYFTFSYSPIRDETGGVGGMLCVCSETTGRVVGERRLRLLRDLAACAAKADGVAEVQARCLAVLDGARADLPFALLYAQEEEGGAWRLRGAAGDAAGLADAAWPLDAVARGETVALDAVAASLPDAAEPRSPWGDPVTCALALPVADRGQERVGMALVLGISPRRALDHEYRDFLALVASGIATALADAGAFEAERRRAEALAALDRAKTAFFSNVSHEFRTPLTLLLGPLEEMLGAGTQAPEDRERAEAAHRGALRLLRLVNTLLDFSRVESGRVSARFVPTDLAALTADLASAFRSACERAGLTLTVDCPPLPEPLHVDREMWEKIVLNLLSNAFKFTFKGGIAVTLRAEGGQAVLEVRDTGTGIPAAELPHLFERFHRVEGAVGRSHEGSGIGLALVRELARLHGGEVSVESTPGHGSSFTVAVPLGTAHLPREQVRADPAGVAASPAATRADAFVEEALRWLPEPQAAPAAADAAGPRVLVADDNADMRDYLRRLLRDAGYRVTLAPDGAAALAAARAEPPDLVLSDVMMPRLDGFGLLHALRAEPLTRGVPVLLLSARAGQEARLEGLDAGADDYVTKPFVARELLARVGANLRLARMRRDAAAAQRESDARFRALTEASSYVVYSMSADWTEMRQLEGRGFLRDTPEPTADWLQDYIPPEERERVMAAIGAAIEGKRLFELEHQVYRPDGSIGWTLSRAVPILDERGAVVEWFGAASDVTARRAAEERQALLAREVDHRAKNALAVVQAALRLTPKEDPASFAQAIEGRVATLARAHTILAAGKWQSAALRELVEAELVAFLPPMAGVEDRVVLEGPALALAPDAVQALSMTLHELATNAAKYGALSEPDGRVSLAWRIDPTAGMLRLRWREQGGPRLDEPPTRRGFGTRVIQATVETQLGGTVERHWEPAGLVCDIAVPVARTLAGSFRSAAE